jgi:hypothetical protein
MTKQEIIGLLEEHIKKLRYGPFDPSKTKEEFFGLTVRQAEELLERVRADDEETIRKMSELLELG